MDLKRCYRNIQNEYSLVKFSQGTRFNNLFGLNGFATWGTKTLDSMYSKLNMTVAEIVIKV